MPPGTAARRAPPTILPCRRSASDRSGTSSPPSSSPRAFPCSSRGDEAARTQQGNNNAYCQDNEIAWQSWPLPRTALRQLEFTRQLIRLRLDNPVFHRRLFFQGRRIQGSAVKDVSWFRPDGKEMMEDEWSNGFTRCLGLRLAGDAIEEMDAQGQPIVGDTFLLLLNAHHEAIPFILPAHQARVRWELVVDTRNWTVPRGAPSTAPGRTIRWKGARWSSCVSGGPRSGRDRAARDTARPPHAVRRGDARRRRHALPAVGPSAQSVELWLADRQQGFAMPRDAAGWAERVTRDAPTGTRYSFRIDGELLVPDPASRYQPLDVHGPSEVVDPYDYAWSDSEWHGIAPERLVFYELHVGTFTREGTFAGVADRLDHLVALGITAVELMPVADFPGRWGWGYDGVLPFAPDAAYGQPEDLKALVEACHARGLAVFLDVVYNHFGPEGNYLPRYAPSFFSRDRKTPWGDALNFDAPGSEVARAFVVHNALYWLDEFHLDGLRLDAVHAMADGSERPRAHRAGARGGRRAGP